MTTFPRTPFRIADIDSLGLSRRVVRDAENDGTLRRMPRGVYVLASEPDTIGLRCLAVSLVVHERHVIRDRTAAWLHGIDVFGWNEMELLPPVETSALRGRSVSRRSDLDSGSRDLAPVDLMYLHGLTVTTPVRTAMDLGCSLSGRDGLAVLDAFMREHAITTADFERRLGRYRRRRGVIQLRRLVAWADPKAESPAESWVRYEILAMGMKPPALQHWVTDHGVPVFRLDLSYPHLKIVIEYDGEEFHGPDQQAHDEERRTWLREHGWYVLVLDKDSMSAAAVDAWLAELRHEMRSRSARRRYR